MKCHEKEYGRTYDDYLNFMKNPPLPFMKAVQVDSVIGKRNDRQALLNIYFPDSKFQIGRLYYKKADDVVRILGKLHKIGREFGYSLFDVVLADNGPEFHRLYELEIDKERKGSYLLIRFCLIKY